MTVDRVYQLADKMRKSLLLQSLLEALLVMFWVQIPIFFGFIFSISKLTNADLESISYTATYIGNLKLGDVFVYATGILGTTSVYFVMKFRRLKSHPVLILYCIVFPFFVILLSVPVFVYSIDTKINPNYFMIWYGYIMVVLMLIAWIVSLYHQKSLDNQTFDIEEHQKIESIQSSVEKALDHGG